MNRILRKDPIVEAVCEFRFDSPDWDWTVPGLLWEQIKDTFSQKQGFDVVPEYSRSSENPPNLVDAMQMSFWSEDETALVRIEPNKLGIVQLKPYSGWPKFKADIEHVLKRYNEIVPTGDVIEASLRYVNRMDLPRGEFELSDLFKIYPAVPMSGETYFGSWFCQLEIFKPEVDLCLNVRAGFVPLEPEPRADGKKTIYHAMLLDIGAEPTSKRLERDRQLEWLEKAHTEIETFFFDCLAESYIETLEPEQSHENF